MTDLFEKLAAEFPRDAIHWRAQSMTNDGSKALALAYLDARDVMDRLDEACGPGGWQNECVETAKGRMIGKISILVDGQWITKCDGAGDTDVEGEKGGISDALKRAAVLWGIGRYLYRLPNVWAPCESYEKNGKKHWKSWKGSPWDHVRGFSGPVNTAQKDASFEIMIAAINKAESIADLTKWSELHGEVAAGHSEAARIRDTYKARMTEINAMDRSAA